MKLHLPKLLFVAITSAASFTLADVTSVAFHTGADNLPSQEGNCVILESLSLGAGDKYGAFDKDGNALALGQMLYEKPVGGAWKDKSSGNATKNVVVSNTLTINDDAEVRLGGQYRLVNNYYISTSTKADEYTGIIADKIVVTGKENNDGSAAVTNLSTWNATVNTLEVNSGKVEIRRQVQSGNNYFNFGAPQDSKQAQFKRAININGGETYINLNSLDSKDKPYNNLDDQHIFSTFGEIVFKKGGKDGAVTDYTKADYAEVYGATITQTAGKLVVEGKTASVGGLNINQQGGTMCISTNGVNYHSWHILSDYGDSKIEQSGAAGTVLNIGGIGAFNSKYSAVVDKLANYGAAYDDASGELTFGGEKVDVRPVLELIQSGAGEINIFKGVDFSDHKKANVEDSSITQSGGGKINLGGEYKGVVFDIMQSGKDIAKDSESISTINVKGDLTADVVNQDGNGSIVVSSGKTLTANSVNAGVLTYETQNVGGKEVQVVTGGSVEMNGNVSLSGGSISSADKKVTITGTLAADNITVSNGSTLENSVNSVISVGDSLVLTNGSKLVNNGTITGSTSAYALMTADEQAAELLSGVEGLIVLEDGSEVLNAGIIDADVLVQGGILTLGQGGITQDITMESGSILVTGNGVETGSLTLSGGTITFVDGATVALKDDVTCDLSGVEIVVMVDNVDNVVGNVFSLFEGAGDGTVTGWDGATVKFQDANDLENVVTGTITAVGNGSFTVNATVSVPEPTTATLSLLALAGLCARRRRR